MSLSDIGLSKTGKGTAMTGTRTESKTLKQQDLFSSLPVEQYVPPQLQSPQAPKQAMQEKPIQEVPIQKSLRSGKFDVVKWLKRIALFITALSVFQSSFFSFDWFNNMLLWPFAVIMAIIIVSSSTLLPDFSFMLFKKGGWYTLLGSFTLILGLIAMSFSMMSTIAGLYNARSSAIKIETTVNADNDKNLRLLESAKSEAERLTKEIDRLNREIDANLAKSASPFSSKAQVNTADYYVQKGKKDRLEYEKSLSKINIEVSRLEAITIVTKVNRQDFYTFIAGLFGWDAGAVEFVFAAFPACFLDIIAPVMLAVALFL